jgi:hypothetical protein
MNTTQRNYFRKKTTAPQARRANKSILNGNLLPHILAIPIMGLATAAVNGEQVSTETLDSLWGLANLYKDESNTILQEFKLRGRYHGQFHLTEADQGDDSDWEDRRSRFGCDAKLFEKQIEIRADFQSNDGFKDIYDGLVDAYIRWKPNKKLSVTIGKTKPLIGAYDWLEPTISQPTFERSQIFNQLSVNRATALTVEGRSGSFSWQTGIYSNDTPSNTSGSGSFGDGEFGDLNGGVSYSIGAGYDFKERFGTDKALLRFDWLHSDRGAGDSVLGRYEDIVSITFWLKEDRAALVIEAFHATGGTAADTDVLGFFVQPTYDLVPDKFQLVGRYTYSASDGPTGIRPQSRYETLAGALRGESYHAIYLGGQYFIYGDKLKLLAGAEYSLLGQSDTADRYDGITALAGLRFSF